MLRRAVTRWAALAVLALEIIVKVVVVIMLLKVALPVIEIW
jgi:hypothetical protein